MCFDKDLHIGWTRTQLREGHPQAVEVGTGEFQTQYRHPSTCLSWSVQIETRTSLVPIGLVELPSFLGFRLTTLLLVLLRNSYKRKLIRYMYYETIFLSPYIYKSVSGSVNLDIAISSAWIGWDKIDSPFFYLIIVALCSPFPVPYWQYWSTQGDRAPNQKDITSYHRRSTRNRYFEFVDVCTAGTMNPGEIHAYPLVVVSNPTDRRRDQCWSRI